MSAGTVTSAPNPARSGLGSLARRFGTVDHRTVSQEVRSRLFEAIRSGAIRPGDAFPSERSLADDFGVARTSVREAIQGLYSLGLLVRRSNRTHLVELLPDLPTSPPETRKVKVKELFEVRQAIELPMARLTAERATDEERHTISELASRFSPQMSVGLFRDLDHAFHSTLASACGNELLCELYGRVLDRLFHSSDFDSILTAAVNRGAVRRIIRDSVLAHRAIASAIARRSPDQVTSAVQAHLSEVETHLVARLI